MTGILLTKSGTPIIGWIASLLGLIMEGIFNVLDLIGIPTQVAQLVNIPGGIINIPVAGKAVPDVAAVDLLIPHAPSVPQSKVGNDEDGPGKLDVQIGTLIIQIIAVDFLHQGHALMAFLGWYSSSDLMV